MGETEGVNGGGPGPAGRAEDHSRRRRAFSKRTGRAIAAVCTVAILLMLVASPTLLQPQTVKVALLVPLTGVSSYLVDVRDGMLLALERLNRWGGMNGAEIELLVRDTESDPAKAVEAFNELERDEKPLFYISTMSHLTLPLTPLAEEAQVVLVGVVTSAQNLTEDKHWTVRFYSDAQDESDATMHILDVLDVGDLGILYGTDEFSTSVEGILASAFSAYGGSVATHQVASADLIDDAVSLMMDREAVFLGMTAILMRDTLLSLREHNYTGHILTASGGTSNLVRSIPEAEGVYVAAPAMYNENYLPAQWLAEEFEARYGRPLTHYATCGYDVLNLFSGLMRDAELTRENVHEVVEKGFVFAGTTGAMQVDPGSHDIGFDLLSARISEGRLWYL